MLFIVVLVIVSALFGIMFFYGDEVKQSLLDQLNQRMKVELTVEEIQLDLFSNFPKASLRFKEINSMDKQSSAGKSLLKAGEIALLFNVLDIFKGTYKIEKINLRDAFLNLSVQANGDVNYQIFEKGDSVSGGEVIINLKKAKFKNVVISYIHIPSQQEYLFRIDEGSLQGEFSSHLQQITFQGALFSTHIKSGKNTFLKQRQLDVNTEISIDENTHTITFNKCSIHSEGLDFHVKGAVNTEEEKKNLDLQILVDQSPLRSLILLIPSHYLTPLNNLSLDGDVNFSAHIAGNFSGNNIPQFDIEFVLKDGKASHKKSSIKLTNIKLSGNFSNGKTRSEQSYRLELNDINSTFNGGKLDGSITISNFNKPRVHTRIISGIELETLSSLFHIDTLESLKGIMKLDMEFKNTLPSFRNFTIQDFISSQTSGSMEIEHTNFRLKGSPHIFRDFNGSFRFNNKDLEIKQFSGYVSSSDFNMKGYFRNILAYAFLPGESIFIDAVLESQKINLDEILNTGNETAAKKNRLVFSNRVNYNLDLRINTFTFRKFSSTNNSGQISQKNKVLRVNNTRFNSMDGLVHISGSINGKDDQVYFIHCEADIEKVNIHKLFYDFGDFGQRNITSDHLRGKVDARVEYSSTLSPYLFVKQKSVYTLADLQIYDGELINYQPLQKLSKYVRQDEFEHVKFSTLKNKIKIENEVVHIPQMDIESSSMSLTLYGNHTFSNDINYHIQLLLSEVIARKEVIEEDLGDNFVSDDGLGKTRLFLSMTGAADDPVIKYDTREVRNKISVDLKEEKNELKDAFREEFGKNRQKNNSSTDTLILESGDQKNFQIEWEEQDKKDSIKPAKKVESNKGVKTDGQTKEDFHIIWDEENDTINDSSLK